MLDKHPTFAGVEGPLLLVIMDGIGLSPHTAGNAWHLANTPTLDALMRECPSIAMKAHGEAVGMPSDADMGNSEVGHNAMGAGKVYHQGAALVSEAIATGELFTKPAWRDVAGTCADRGSTLHFIGLFSDGNVHSRIGHLQALVERAKADGVRRVRIHVLLDGRDVPETSALDYVDPFETFLAECNGADFDARIASGGGRMRVTMDRYEADWAIVERGWRTHVLGEGPQFESARSAIETFRRETPGVSDQDLPPFVVASNGTPVGTIEDGDGVICFNFRGDRAIEISRAFEEDDLAAFDRVRRPAVAYAGMLQYDGDLEIPKRYLVPPPSIRDTIGEYLAAEKIAQLAISETQKYGHVTYFWNGNRSGKFDETAETYVEVPSDRVPFEQRPWMKSAEITDRLIEELRAGSYRFARVNYANGDMVGHTGKLDATIVAVEAVDLALARVLPVVDQLGGVALVTADHGNAEQMYELDKTSGEPKRNERGDPASRTAHTLNPVPFILYGGSGDTRLGLSAPAGGAGLSNVAATIVNLLGYQAPDAWDASLLEIGQEPR